MDSDIVHDLASCSGIVYRDADLPLHQMAGLYTAADCLVQPYRGEGFCLPAVEAMACGIPVVVPTGGPTDDFVDESVGWRVLAQRRPMGGNRVGIFECVGEPWMLEVAPEDLARLLRHIAANPEEAKRRGQAGVARVREGWTWHHAANVAIQQIQALGVRRWALSAKQEQARCLEPAALPSGELTSAYFAAASPRTPNAQRLTPLLS